MPWARHEGIKQFSEVVFIVQSDIFTDQFPISSYAGGDIWGVAEVIIVGHGLGPLAGGNSEL